MNESLANEAPKTAKIMFKVSDEKSEQIKNFCRDRDWKLSAFIRVAIEESMVKVLKEESFTDEASGD